MRDDYALKLLKIKIEYFLKQMNDLTKKKIKKSEKVLKKT